MTISVSSAKAKGRKLQQWVRDLILATWPKLSADDVHSTSMGSNGEDLQLSPAARQRFPYSVECKARASIGIYSFYDQAKANAGKHEPLLVVRANRRNALVVVDAEHFFTLIKKLDKNDRTRAAKG